MKTKKRFLSILLSLVLVLGLMPGMSLTAYATSTETLLTTITATGTEQASYSTANVATVSFSNLPDNGSVYTANWGWWGYGWTATITAAEGYNITKCIFYDDANRTATDSEAPFVVETTEEDKTPKVNGTPILANTSKGIKKIEVYGYAAPETPSGYTITIPSTLAVANSGWNATDGISATGTLASGKKLTVTASSANSWALKQQDGNETVSYTMKETSDGEAKTAWEFTTLPGNATLGIDVADYSTKPAGTYQDTVTFTASVVEQAITFTVKRVGGSYPNFADGNYTVAPGTTWQQFIDSGNAPTCLSITRGKVWHDMNMSIMDCGGTLIANVADNKHVKPGDAIIDGATYGCSDYLGYQDHD